MPTTPQNKIKYGLEKVAFAVATIAANNSATYATPIMCPGARSLSLEAQGEQTKWWADNIAYYIIDDNNGYEGDLEVARFPDEVLAAIWNIAKAANGISYEDADREAVHFALLFEFSGDQQKTRHVMYNCTAARPSVSGSTKEESIEPQTETITITATTIHALDKDIVKASCTPTESQQYNSWLTTVYQPA